MKIRLIEIDDEQTQKPLKESPSLELELAELPDWAQSIMEVETWQGNQLELNRLEKLTAEIPKNISAETRNITRWKFNEEEQDIEVDLSLVLGILARDILILDVQNKQRALTLES